MGKLFVTDVSKNQSKKCGGCNWETVTFFGIGENKKKTREIFKGINPKNYGLGLCANCIAELLVQEKHKITSLPFKKGK